MERYDPNWWIGRKVLPPPLFLNTPSLPPLAILPIALNDPKINTQRSNENVYQILPITSFNLKLGTIADG